MWWVLTALGWLVSAWAFERGFKIAREKQSEIEELKKEINILKLHT